MTTTRPTYPNRSRLKHSVSMLAVFTLLTATFAGRAQAVMYDFSETLSGTQEVPPTASPGTGLIVGTYDDVTNMFNFSLSFSGLLGNTTAAHLHAPAAPGTNAAVTIGFVGFPSGVMSGVYANTYTLTATQETHLLSDLMYVNVHTNLFPGGEIRAQINPSLVPEPGTYALMLGGLGLVGWAARRRRRSA